MQVKVCDALCGSGKSSACINMMNSNKAKRYIFVTQYLDEVDRVVNNCKQRNFVSPDADAETKKTKLADIQMLIARGANIATTHSLFLSYTEETKQLIRDQHYTLVLDEVVDVIANADLSNDDIEILKKSDTIRDDGELVTWTCEDYGKDGNGKFRDEMLQAKSKNLLKYADQYFFWVIAPELFTCFEEVYVLTYLFRAQSLRCFFEIYGIPYELIGVTQKNGSYVFCAPIDMNRARDLRDKVHIVDNQRLNSIGDGRTGLSFSWYKKAAATAGIPELMRIQKNVSNVFKNIFKAKADETLWTTFKEYLPVIKGRGYSDSFISYNTRASNKYAARRYLAYCVNNFPRPWEVNFYKEHGADVEGDMYALSILVQWVFRSAIRKGEEIWIYVPSRRMRFLLQQWISNLATGDDLQSIQYQTQKNNYSMKTKGNVEANG